MRASLCFIALVGCASSGTPPPATLAAASPVPASPPSAAVTGANASGDCEALRGLSLPHVTIDDVRAVAASDASGDHPALPAWCRVSGTSRPTPDSEIRFLVAMPRKDAWDGRFVQLGNGGFAGRVREGTLLDVLARGSAAAGTDDGHTSTDVQDASWALGHRERVIDFGYRALKETTEAARAILRAYMGIPPSRSYFVGCSDGGREALMEAQRYPEDFDGVVAGAPANDFTHLFVGAAWDEQALRRSPGHYLSASKLRALEDAARKACAGDDGIIDDPLSCHFNPATLRCKGAEKDDCLTDAQIQTARALYAGPKNPRTGQSLLPGFEPGYEAEPGSWPAWVTGKSADDPKPSLLNFARNFFRYVVFGDPGYDILRLDFDSDVATTVEKVGGVIDAVDPDLGAFRRHGGKLIQVHGWADPAIPPRASIRYYESVRARMGDTSDFYRLFMAPGMFHCYGGPGPDDPHATEAIESWVEQAKAPDRLVATKSDEGDGTQVARSRTLCPYPQVARWDGKGDRARAESYSCAPPRTSDGG
jgi:hypothetical protein